MAPIGKSGQQGKKEKKENEITIKKKKKIR